MPGINIVANKLSAQSLIDSLDRGVKLENGILRPMDSTGFAAAPELTVFLPKQGYVEEIIPVITDIFDAKPGVWKHKTRGSGEVELFNPLFTMLSGSTTDWLLDNIPPTAYAGGFTARIFFVWEEKKKKLIPRPEKTPRLKRLRDELLAELFWIQENLKGEVQWDKEAEEWYEDFYIAWEARARPQDSQEEGYKNRRTEHILRVAICIAAAQFHSLTLTANVLRGAHESLLAIEKDRGKCFERAGTIQAFAANYAMILRQIEVKGPQTKRDLQKALWRHMAAPDLSTGLQTFVDAGLLEVCHTGVTAIYSLPFLKGPS